MVQNEMRKPVSISVKGNMVHYHVFGDEREYLDQTSVIIAHPELAEHMKHSGHNLERELLQQRENFEI